ncbi:hypothetical protein NDR87_34675 [Nocardia sp. CDC159]|uniref:Uncharacterized protein n=1 Tax=Nocardia pulmonis TaxID=2951408 RepID=A0A9X2EH80_9NOCA|nr:MULTISPECIES: hypothetical protein [Nocardia]MCM6778638.1 hypothetical protein [Nocardia pulmonis]MCM6791527.1 hypothetical protein [Nocardia sp. CDC159]
MGRHSAQPSLGLSVRLLMISAAALLTASIAADQGTWPASRFEARPVPDPGALAAPGGPRDESPQLVPAPPAPGELPTAAETPAQPPTSGRGRGGSPQVAPPEPPAPAGPLDALAQAWTDGTTRGLDLLKGVQEAVIAHLPGLPDSERRAA